MREEETETCYLLVSADSLFIMHVSRGRNLETLAIEDCECVRREELGAGERASQALSVFILCFRTVQSHNLIYPSNIELPACVCEWSGKPSNSFARISISHTQRGSRPRGANDSDQSSRLSQCSV